MARQRLRLVAVRKPGTFDDQKTPAEISTSEVDSADEQGFIEAVLSQIRQVLGTLNWHDPVPISLANLEDREVCNEVPSGVKNYSNQVFTTANFFEPASLKVYVNGVRKSNVGGACDYAVSESGGLGTGYDTITFDLLRPRSDDHVLVDYTKYL